MLGGGIARLAVQVAHEVFVSNSSSPKSLFSLIGQIGKKAKGGSKLDAAAFGEHVVVAIPFDAYQSLPTDARG